MLKGIAAAPGIGIGPVYLIELKSREEETDNSQLLHGPEEIQAELARLEEAIGRAKRDLEELAARTRQEIGEAEAGIFNAHILMLTDPTFIASVKEKIKVEKKKAARAVEEIAEAIASSFAVLDDDLFRERAADIRDVAARLLDNLAVGSRRALELKAGSIVVARELTPSLTANFTRNTVAGIATEIGGPTSHTAIVARALGIPAVLGVQGLMNRVRDGELAIIDGSAGVVYLNPGSELLEEYKKKKAVLEAGRRDSKYAGPARTRDGRHIEVAANIRNAAEVKIALEHGAGGVGLFRTEFLFMNREEPPGEEEQLQAYKEVVAAFQGKPVVVRTLDVGGDKPLPYLNPGHEENPFLGLRGLRLCLTRQELFKTQLKALLRAASYGNLKIMFPMVTTLEEIRQAKKIMAEARMELEANGLTVSHVETGIMIEVPAAALMADVLAREVDFFSIGTNDLAQYTLAVDRGNERVAGMYDACHPAVLRLIDVTVKAAHRYGKWVGLCGELASEIQAAPLLVGLGLDEISMSPVFIPPMKEAVNKIAYHEARELVRRLLELPGPREVRAALSK
ncbi:phosphoenolpyruvate-protein phosphotransferase [Moorella sp. E308F]|uniref:phosphoenolpyruvate--protein phosphotransferase n=1 Tax=unclassified Neomoorella TaxID=2676739 RepID=UPI0010FFAB8E|nr:MULTISPECIES: phosphoenolpyruvate--protein phosphotransferase [unclassified Moorella (in: firmicutes)]GEA14172.1 phosphoenolpyruvate-protein phosphotransferase [Moorella sp. E308F]GEA18443.1 phosphoenolpyruvate-protein phosphotransferase [Moorella sp. E306M]